MTNYIFCEKTSLPHTAHALSKLKILKPVRKDLREKHILLGLQTRRPEVDTALNLMNLQPKIGIQNEAKVLGVKNTELRAFYRKIESERSKCGDFPVPSEFSHIFESDPQNGDFVGEAHKSTFFQAKTENFCIFFLERELIYLESQICCLDGTFHVVKNLPFSQLFMISAQFRHQENVLTVPLIFIFMRERKTVNYEEVFGFLKNKFENVFDREL